MNWKSPYLLLVIATVIWGGNFVLGRAVAGSIPPYTLSFFRWGIAALVILPFIWHKLKEEKDVLSKNIFIVLLMSLTGIAGFNTLLYVALQYTTSINASLVNTSAPLMIAVLSFFVIGERLNKYQVTGVFISLIGVFWIVSKGSWIVLTTLSFNLGDLLMVLAVFVWAVYSVLIKRFSKRVPFYSTFALTIILGVFILAPFFIWEIAIARHEIIWSPLSISTLLYVGVLASLIAFITWNTAVSKIGAAKASVFLNLIPVFASCFAILFLGEKIAWYQLLGGAFVLIGIGLSTKKTKEGKKQEILVEKI